MTLLDSENELILSYVFESDNLETALKVNQIYDEIRKKILLKFFNTLKEELRKALSEEEEVIIHNDLKDNIYERGKGVFITKKKWGDKYSIGIWADANEACRFYIGITKRADLEPINEGIIKKVLNEEYRKGAQHDNNEWYYWLDEPYYNFKDIDLLVKIYKETDEVVKIIFNQIIELKRRSEEIIDQSLADN